MVSALRIILMPICKTSRFGFTVALGLAFGLLLAPYLRNFETKEDLSAPLTSNSMSKLTGSEVEAEMLAIQKAERVLDERVRSSVRLLCWVMHDPAKRMAREAILRSWGRRCSLLLFMTGKPSPMASPTPKPRRPSNRTQPRHAERIGPNAVFIVLEMVENYRSLWAKTRAAFLFVHRHYADRFDWVLKVDDDSYVLVHNLLLFILALPPEPRDEYYGCPYKGMGGYNSGGPGYFMSKRVLGKLVEAMGRRNAHCAPASVPVAEDVEVAKCLRSVGVSRGDTRDSLGRFRFSPFDPSQTMHHHLLSKHVKWFWNFSQYKLRNGPECCSDTFISYHYVKPDHMLTMEYLIYGLHPFSRREVWEPAKPFPPIPSLPPPD